MSTLETNLVQPSTGTSLTLGASGDTITIPSGATITNSGTATGFGGVTEADIFSLTSNVSLSAATQTIITGMARATYTGVGRIGTGISHSSGVFSFTNTGIYKIVFKARFQKNGSTRFVGADIYVTTDNSTYTQATGGAGNIYNFGSTGYTDSVTEIILDVTDTSNVKVKPNVYSDSTSTVSGNGGSNAAFTTISFIRLGDT
tara:strand:+ start:22 stop:627 length:606 start_codon:yes stop_codon:yes gene_type:complete